MASLLQYSTMVLALTIPVLASPLLEDRAVCNRNNLVRCFDPTGTKSADIASRSAATAFCSSFLSIPVVTVTTATTTPLASETTAVSTTDATEVQTSTATSTVLVTQRTTTTTTLVGVFTTARPPSAGSNGKRAVATGAPACATRGVTYAPSSLSAACSCLSVTPSTTFVIATAPTSTNTQTSIIHETTTSTTSTTTRTSTTTTETATATKIPAVCPGETYTASTGRIYCIEHNKFISSIGYMGDYTNVFGVASLQACADLCATTYAPRCVGVSFRTSQGNRCDLINVPSVVLDPFTADIAYPLPL